MTLKLALITAACLAAASATAAGAGCSKHKNQAMSCAEGSVWDSGSQSCVPQTSS